MGTLVEHLVSCIWSRNALASSNVDASVTSYTKMKASADDMERARIAGNSYAPDVSRMSSVRWTPSTLKSPWCISSTVRLYFDENVLYRNCVIMEDLPTFAAPITTILWRTTLLATGPTLSLFSTDSTSSLFCDLRTLHCKWDEVGVKWELLEQTHLRSASENI